MEIKILGWGYNNIRRFNNLEIDLTQGGSSLPHVSLVMMRNGTGKTTTITLIRAILSGSAKTWTPSQVREFSPKSIDASSGKFYLKMRFDAEVYYFILLLDYENGTASYKTSRVGAGSGGLDEGRDLPMSLRGVFDVEEFVNRFIFDGEQAKKTLNSGSAEAENAIRYLYQFDKLDALILKIRDLMTRKQEASRGASQSSVKNNRTRMENKKRKYDELLAKAESLEALITEKEAKKIRLETRKSGLLSSNERIRKQAEELKTKQAERRSDLVGYLSIIKARMREPYRVNPLFDVMLKTLANNMQTLKLPKTTAREFFRELSAREFCICGRPIGPDEKAKILHNAEDYLGEEDLVAINAIKDRIRNYHTSDELQTAITDMKDTKDDLDDITSTLERLILQLDGDALREAKAIEGELSQLSIELASLKHEKEKLYAPAGTSEITDQNNIPLAKKSWEEAKENFNIALGTYEYTMKAEKLTDYIEEVKSLTLNKLKLTIVQKTNTKIEKIITDERIIIDRIDGCLVIRGRSGVSEGQTLAIAYAYICSLFEHSKYEFPFVIDSPAASMDLGVRREVASVIPTLFKQLIIFVTSGEVAGFAEKLYARDDITYLTVEGAHEDNGAKCTVGKDYFSTYQCEGEE